MNIYADHYSITERDTDNSFCRNIFAIGRFQKNVVIVGRSKSKEDLNVGEVCRYEELYPFKCSFICSLAAFAREIVIILCIFTGHSVVAGITVLPLRLLET